jgi:hypothetical protein
MILQCSDTFAAKPNPGRIPWCIFVGLKDRTYILDKRRPRQNPLLYFCSVQRYFGTKPDPGKILWCILEGFKARTHMLGTRRSRQNPLLHFCGVHRHRPVGSEIVFYTHTHNRPQLRENTRYLHCDSLAQETHTFSNLPQAVFRYGARIDNERSYSLGAISYQSAFGLDGHKAKKNQLGRLNRSLSAGDQQRRRSVAAGPRQ